MSLSDKEAMICNLGAIYYKKGVKEFIKRLKDKNFIMDILAECIEIDKDNNMKFIDISKFRKKIDKLAGDLE